MVSIANDVCMQVCTAQYFVWWFTLLPLVMPTLDMSWSTGITSAAVAWVLTQAHWLGWAYMLEFQGRAVHLAVWVSSVMMCAATIYLMKELIRCSRTQLFVLYHPKLHK